MAERERIPLLDDEGHHVVVTSLGNAEINETVAAIIVPDHNPYLFCGTCYRDDCHGGCRGRD